MLGLFRFSLMLATLWIALPVFAGDEEPDTRSVIALVGRHTLAHACPIDSNYAITAAHVTDRLWYDQDYPLSPYRYQNELGDYGIAIGTGVLASSDLGTLRLNEGISSWYSVARHAPQVDEKVYWVEYETDDKGHPFEPRVEKAEVKNVVAGTIYTDHAPEPGSSGGCLFSASGEVYGIVSAGWRFGTSATKPNVGAFVGIYGQWEPERPKSAKEEGAPEGEQEQEEVDPMYGAGYPYADEGNQ